MEKGLVALHDYVQSITVKTNNIHQPTILRRRKAIKYAIILISVVFIVLNNSNFDIKDVSETTYAVNATCNDPWDAGFMSDDTTWKSTVLNPCSFEYYSRIFIENESTDIIPDSLEFLRDKSVVMVGDSCDRYMADVICNLPHFDGVAVEIGDPERFTYDAGFRGTHLVCRHQLLNFTMLSFFTYALNKNMSEEVVLWSHHREGEPKVTWERIEIMLTSVLSKLHIMPTLITINSGYWNMQHSEKVDPAEVLNDRVRKYTEGMYEFLIPSLRRLFPSSLLAFRLTPYAQRHGRLHLARLVNLYNVLMEEQGWIWNMPLLDPRLTGLGMYHIYQDDSHQGKPLMLMYLDMVLNRLHDAIFDKPGNKFKAFSASMKIKSSW